MAEPTHFPCAQCTLPVPAARFALPAANERCVECNAPMLKTSRESRHRANANDRHAGRDYDAALA